MPMAHRGLAKLTEELGELQQVVGKILAFGTGSHPDGTTSLLERYEEEAADVIAAIVFVVGQNGMDITKIIKRVEEKNAKFAKWEQSND